MTLRRSSALLRRTPKIQLQDGWLRLTELGSGPRARGTLPAVHPTVRRPSPLAGLPTPPSAGGDLAPRGTGDQRLPQAAAAASGATGLTPEAACAGPGSRPVASPGGEGGARSSALLTGSHATAVSSNEDLQNVSGFWFQSDHHKILYLC